MAVAHVVRPNQRWSRSVHDTAWWWSGDVLGMTMGLVYDPTHLVCSAGLRGCFDDKCSSLETEEELEVASLACEGEVELLPD
jgi:hypothetical protein